MTRSPIDTFYPTPPALIAKMLEGIDFTLVSSVLEPSAGKGDLADEVKQRVISAHRRSYNSVTPDIDTIEINPDLQHVLKGKGYRVIFDDFLKFSTFKHYDLIVMNPPFADGDRHLQKALELQARGGGIVCILNAETVRDPRTYPRQELVKTLDRYGAEITYLSGEFRQAERKTDVEVALIKVCIPSVERDSVILDSLERGPTIQDINAECHAVNVNEYISAVVRTFEEEVKVGLQLIRDYKTIEPMILSSICNEHARPILKLTVEDSSNLSENKFLQQTRAKYWENLFMNPKFTLKFTSNLLDQCRSDVKRLQDYDFNEYNINVIRLELTQKMIRATDDTIIALFDELTHEHHWYPESTKNRHYFNGWATNKAWKVNKKVILPLSLYNYLTDRFCSYSCRVEEEIADLDKTLRYLSGGNVGESGDVAEILARAKQTHTTKNIEFEFFTITCYKKGTTHITFTDEALLKRFNIYGCQHKSWLPPSYGRTAYKDMDPKEKAVIDDYEGEKEYEETMRNAQYFLGACTNIYPALTDSV